MIFSPFNFIYFFIVLPIVLVATFFIKKLHDKEKHLSVIIGVGLLVFFVRIMLVFFQSWIGIMPYILPDVIFYTLLMIFGIVYSTFYVLKVEKITFQELGFTRQALWRNIGLGFLGLLPLIAMFPLVVLLTGIRINPFVTWEKVVIGITFGLILAGFFEEIMFRGIMQKHFMEITDEKYTVLGTTTIFVATHIGYLPLVGFGIIYIFLTVMALLLSYFRLKFGLISCSILHGGIVFILVLFV